MGYYVKEYLQYQTELLVPAFISGRFDRSLTSACKAVIDTGSNCCLIEEDWILDELHLAARIIHDSFYQPQRKKTKMGGTQKEYMQVVDLFVAIGNPPTRIEGLIEAVLVEEVDHRSRGIKAILGMDFLNTMNITYIAGRQGSIFGLLQGLLNSL